MQEIKGIAAKLREHFLDIQFHDVQLQILAIHGYRQSDKSFSGKLGSLRKSFKREIDFTFARAPHQVPPIEQTPDEDAPETERKV